MGEERGWKPSTTRTAFASLQQFFQYLAEEGEVAQSPLARLRPPKVAEEPVPVLADDELVRLLRICVGKNFEERRDQAILRLFIDTGPASSATRPLSLCGATSGNGTGTPAGQFHNSGSDRRAR